MAHRIPDAPFRWPSAFAEFTWQRGAVDYVLKPVSAAWRADTGRDSQPKATLAMRLKRSPTMLPAETINVKLNMHSHLST